ncbi:MAG: hypothetical protein HQ490_04320 [Lutibacter sp.]|nr:hypothetical protein [Lutibacter sp.]
MKISFDVRGNKKQLEAAKAWVDKTTNSIAYGGSKNCFSENTLVKTNLGYKKIVDISKGDYVLSINTKNDKKEYNKVLNRFSYGGYTHSNNFCVFTLNNNLTIKCTENHEFYFERNWISAIELARRIMELRGEYRQEIFDINKRSSNDHRLQGKQNAFNNETSIRRKRLYENNSSERQEEYKCKDSQTCSKSVYTKHNGKITSKPYRLQPVKQSGGEFGVVYTEREYATLCKSRKNEKCCISERLQTEKPEYWGESLECKINRKRSNRNTEKIQTKNIHKRNVRDRIQREGINDKRCYSKTELDSREITLDEIQKIEFETSNELIYDLNVENNHNYCVTTENIIVHNSGKSFLGVNLIFGDAFLYPETRYFIARKTLADLVKHTIPSIHEVFKLWGIADNMYKYDGKNNIWKLHNGSEVLFLDAKPIPSDPDYHRFGSMQMTRGWIEEAGEFEKKCRDNLFISLGRCKNDEYDLYKKLLETCNPAKNYLYDEYYIKFRNGTLPDNKKFIQALPTDNKTMTADYYEGLLETLDQNGIERLIKGNWEYDDNNLALFDYNKILGLYTNSYVEATGNMYMTADIAYQGSDIFVIGIWNGFVLEKIIAIDKISEVMVSSKINELRLKYGIPISNVIYDADGIKLFVRNSAKEGFLKGARQFRNGSKAYGNENYQNLKTQCYFKLAEMVNKGLIFIKDETHKDIIIKELSNIRKIPLNDDGKIKLEKKEDYRKRTSGKSYDYADMMQMRMITEVKTAQEFSVKWL